MTATPRERLGISGPSTVSWFCAHYFSSLVCVSLLTSFTFKPVYLDGIDGLQSLGCNDRPLFRTLQERSDVLRFVHIVLDLPELEDGDDEGASSVEAMTKEHSKKDDESSTSEEEFHDSDDDAAKSTASQASSTEDESKFEA